MKYTRLTRDLTLELNRAKRDAPTGFNHFDDPTHFAIRILGLFPYTYQHQILRRFKESYRKPNNRTIICKSRQIGMSICLAILAIWYASYNKANKGEGTGIHRNTKVGIISKSDDQAKKLMKEIQNMVFYAKDESIKELVRKGNLNPLNKKELHFKEGWIKCYPPTGASRGESFDLLIIDEAGFVDSQEYQDAMAPTVDAVNGKIILSSTPNGQKGFFFEEFDPEDTRKDHEYERFWYWWQMCENKIQKKLIEQKLKYAKETGTVKSFDQEYNALFTVDEEAFFENADIENGADKSLSQVYEYDGEDLTSVGIDYGGANSATTITVVRKRKNRIEMLFQFAQTDFDYNLLSDPEWDNSVQNLKKRYNPTYFVVDDCAAGIQSNQYLENEGYPIVRFNFRADSEKSERNRGYFMFRNALKKLQIKYPENRSLMAEMKAIQEIRMQVHVRIKAPSRYRDDRVDGLVMACYPFLRNSGTFTSKVITYDTVNEKMNENQKDWRHDQQWDKLKNQSHMYDFLLQKETRGKKKLVDIDESTGVFRKADNRR